MNRQNNGINPPAEHFNTRFRDETHELLLTRTKYVFIIASILYPCFSGLDWLTTSEHAPLFFFIRLAVSANFLIGLILLQTEFGKKLVLPISIWGGYVSILGVIIMTTHLNGFLSHYYVGIVLILFIPGLFLPWDLCATIIFGLSSIVTYLMLNLTLSDPATVNLSDAAGPFFFMTWSVAFMGFANVEKEKTRRRDLTLRMQIEKSNQDLKELDKTKMRFFSNVSHELRTPLTLIIGPLEQLLQGSRDIDPVPVLKAMEANAHRLLRQVNTILDFAKADYGRLICHYKKGNLGKILQDLVRAAIPYSKQKHIEMTISGTQEITDTSMDTEKVETIAANLISNALKFTPENGKIIIHTGMDAESIWFQVKDTGMGIPEDKLESVFERFLQVDDQHSRKNEGTGLGLAMVRELVSLHGGDISVDSTLGEGSVFRVQLPVKPPAPMVERRKTAGRRKSDRVSEAWFDGVKSREYNERSQNSSKTLLADVVNGTRLDESASGKTETLKKSHPANARKILVVEDNPDLRAFIVSNLADLYHVEQAANGRIGLDLAKRVNPDLILSDVMMPEMDGYELCRQIRKDHYQSDVPIILVTAKSGGEAVEAGFEIGANDYVPKPFEMRELKARIATQLKNRSLEKSINERDTRLAAIGQRTNSVVHDLRSPLNALMGFIQLAQQISRDVEDKEISNSLEKAMDHSWRLNRMIDEILAFSRGYAAKLNLVSMELVSFLEPKLSLHRSELASMDITLESVYEHGDEIQVSFDSDQIQRVIDNLITNAKESFFTSDRSVDEKRIWVRTRREDNYIILQFSDNGPGIPDQIKDSLFDPFTTSGKKKGTGLGLATVSNIVKAHSGEIRVESHGPDKGAMFELKFPKA